MSRDKIAGLRTAAALAMAGIMTVTTPAMYAAATEPTTTESQAPDPEQEGGDSAIDKAQETYEKLSDGKLPAGEQVDVADIPEDILEKAYRDYTRVPSISTYGSALSAYEDNLGVQALYAALVLSHASSEWETDTAKEQGLYIDGAELSLNNNTGDTDIRVKSKQNNPALSFLVAITTDGDSDSIRSDFPATGDPVANAAENFKNVHEREDLTSVVWREVYERRDTGHIEGGRDGAMDRAIVNQYSNAAMQLVAMWDSGITDVAEFSKGIEGADGVTNTSGDEGGAGDAETTTPTTSSAPAGPETTTESPDPEGDGAGEADTTTPESPDSEGDGAGEADTTTPESPDPEGDGAGEGQPLTPGELMELFNSGSGELEAPELNGEYTYGGTGSWNVRRSMDTAANNVEHTLRPGESFTVVKYAQRVPGGQGKEVDNFEDASWVLISYNSGGTIKHGMVTVEMFYAVEKASDA